MNQMIGFKVFEHQQLEVIYQSGHNKSMPVYFVLILRKHGKIHLIVHIFHTYLWLRLNLGSFVQWYVVK